MSFTNPKFKVARPTVVGSEGLWCKMFDPPRLGPPTPEMLDLTTIGLDGNPSNPKLPLGLRANPVPSVMQAAGMSSPATPYTYHTSLMHGDTRPTWDGGALGGRLNFFLFAGNDLIGTVPDLADPGILTGTARTIGASAPQFPAPTVRVPRGAVVQNKTDCQGPPPHTIHWHGIEPTPMNDGVGHCSFEVEGAYTYQWQPNFIGTYFYHCHRNTMMHFEYGLAGIMPFNPPDAWFASIATVVDPLTGVVTLNNVPIGHGRPEPGFPLGRFRTATNLNLLPTAVSGLFPGFVGGDPVQGVATPDPWTGDPFLKFKYDPHAFTVPYDVECLWVMDDRSSEWSDGTKDPFSTFPAFGTIPGVNDKFHENAAFFGFNDFNADYWYISGVPVAAKRGGSVTMPTNLIYPAVLNGGIAGTRVDIKAGIGQTVLVRQLNAAYNSTRTTFPMDVVIIEWDGRAMGVPPLNQYTRPILVPAGTPIVGSTARRWSAILNSKVAVNTTAKVEFLDTRSASQLTLSGGGEVLATVRIPIVIS